MGWDENVFEKAEKWWTHYRLEKKQLLPSAKAAHFEELKTFLGYWTMLLSGKSWVLQESESWPAVESERLFYPAYLEIFTNSDLNRQAYLYMTCLMLGYDEVQFPALQKKRLEFQTAEFCKSELSTEEKFYLYNNHSQSAINAPITWDAGSFRSPLNLWVVRTLHFSAHARVDDRDSAARKTQIQNVKKKKAREQIQVINELGNELNENPLVHSFEKLHTTDDYNGGQKKQDGEDDLNEQADSIEDLDLRQVVRSHQETKAALKGDYIMDIDVAESADLTALSPLQIFKYPEWNEKQRSYHLQWCTLEERRELNTTEKNLYPLDQVKKINRNRIDRLVRCFYDLFQTPHWQTRQQDGTELDLDALVDDMATPIHKRSEKMKVYLNRKKDLNELAVIILFDRSLSTDSWVDNRRVLDIIRDSLVVAGEALKLFSLPVQLASFSSQTRNHIYYDILKNFDENWDRGLNRLGDIEPMGYTRIGPALRHATALLKEKKARHKWILLVSDSKPTDYDKYEGHHGLRDVRKAIEEARQFGVGCRCLSIGKENRSELAEMFGLRGYELLVKLDHLPERLGQLLKDLVQAARH